MVTHKVRTALPNPVSDSGEIQPGGSCAVGPESSTFTGMSLRLAFISLSQRLREAQAMHGF